MAVGSIINVKFTQTNTAQNPTFTVKYGTTTYVSKKTIWYNTTQITTGNLWAAGYAGRVMSFMWDGTQFWWVGQSIDNNTTYSMASLGNIKGTCSTAASTAAKTVSLSSYALVTYGYVWITFTNGNSAANATLNINSKGAKAIYWNGAAVPAYFIKKNESVLLQYNGTQYDIVENDDYGDLDSSYVNL